VGTGPGSDGINDGISSIFTLECGGSAYVKFGILRFLTVTVD
jgi:hypothetical protein